MSRSATTLPSYVKCAISFGKVPAGTSAVKSYFFKNNHFDAVTYVVTRNAQTNPIYYVFDVNKYEARVKAGAELCLKITYSPNLPGNKDFDYFTVTDSEHNVHRLSFHGECIGPLINCSIRNINFFKTPQRQVTKQVFALSNNSNVSAIYQIDCTDQDQGLFKVDPIKGTISPEDHVHITVKFSPESPGLYSRQLCCLILHHDPILLNLIGVYSTDSSYDNPEIIYRCFPFPLEETVGFKGYFSDSVTIKPVPPPISLTFNYLDFGRKMPESSCQTLTTSFTNHMPNKVVLEWENIKQFRIYPEKLEIPPQQSALYECRFHPEETSALYGVILHGHVSWNVENNEKGQLVHVPIPINLRLIGHSFPKNQIWIPSITILPRSVVLPLSLPRFPSWTTFLLQVLGHLPVMYKLVPPSKTNFLMKPMVGVIRNYQIVAVQLESYSNEKKSYVEQWSIELNGQLQSCMQIYVKAQTDVPCVKVATDNCIHFDPIQPGTQASVYIPVRNISYCPLHYQFLTTEQFKVDLDEGEIAPNEEIYVSAFYISSKEDQGCKKTQTICRVQCINKEKSLIGEPVDIPVTVITEVSYTELCSLPESYECGEVEYNTLIDTCFYLYNFGEVTVNFKFFHNHDLPDVNITPSAGSCGPKEKLMVKVEFTIRNLGKDTLFISYRNRLDRFSDVVSSSIDGGKIIFQISYKCIFPKIQISELLEHNYDLFSNSDLWNLLKINEINTALMEINQGEIRRVDLCVPDHKISNQLFYLVFAIKNLSNFYTDLNLKRRQLCDCKQKETGGSFTFRLKTFDCPHKEMFTMEMNSSCMFANSTHALVCKIKYVLEENWNLSYKMMLSHNRTIILNISLYCIPSWNNILSPLSGSYFLNMGCVYIGLREPPVFAYWVYNNTDDPLPFKLDDTEIIKLCNRNKFVVLKCLNLAGFLKPHTTAPILFKFWPIQVKIYRVSVPLWLGNHNTVLTIEGCGTDIKNKVEFKILKSLGQNSLKNNFLCLSTNHLLIEPLLVSSSTECLFFVNNLSTCNVIEYTWKPIFIDGLLKIEPLNDGGVLGPNESHPVIIKIISLNEPCRIEVRLCMDFVDKEKSDTYQKMLELRRSSLNDSVIQTVSESFASSSFKEPLEEEYFEEPQHFLLALPITVNVVGILDRDNCITVEDQMKQTPPDRIDLKVDEFVKNHFEKTAVKERPIHPELEQPTTRQEPVEEIVDKEMVKSVMDNIASDAIFSNYFKQILKITKAEPPPLYSQIKLNKLRREKQRENVAKRVFTQPASSEVKDICDRVIIDTIRATLYGFKKDRSKNEQ